MSGVISGGKSQTVGFKYFMSVHQAVCRGPVDSFLEVRVASENAWPDPGQPGLDDTGSTNINRPELFGGDKKEGGIVGAMEVLMGYADQVAPASLKSLLSGRVPDYRGIVSIFYDGLICSINPYPKPWSFRVARVFKGWDGEVWYPEKALIYMDDNGAQIRSMNPAHIIYECCTNRVWGRGLARNLMDDLSFKKAADQLYSEGFGLNLKWAREDTLDKFVKDVIDHIGGAVDINRETGLVRLKLIRDDYDLADVPLFEYDSGLIAIEEDETSSKDDIVNEIVVNFVSIFLNQKQQVRVHNLAAVQASGNYKSITTDYVGISSKPLALRVAQRDLKANALSGKRYKVSLDRRGWRLAPADVIRVRALDRGINDLVLRLGKVSDSAQTDGEMTMEAVPDVFGLRDASFVKTEPPNWTPPSKSALPALFIRVEEANYRDIFRGTIPGQSVNIPNDTGYIAVFGGKPTGLSIGYDLLLAAAGEDFKVSENESFTPVSVLLNPLSKSDTIAMVSRSFLEVDRIAVDSAMFVGSEICRVDEITMMGDGVRLTIARGCVDTVPGEHSAGTVCYFPDEDFGSDGREYAEGERVSAKLITFTTSDRQAESQAATGSTQITGRALKPFPPGNFRINGNPFTNPGSPGAAMRFDWSHRDRTIQQDKLFDNSMGNFGPESGVTYRLRFISTSGTFRLEESISNNFFEYTEAMNVADGNITPIIVELESVRDGLYSHQKHAVFLNRTF